MHPNEEHTGDISQEVEKRIRTLRYAEAPVLWTMLEMQPVMYDKMVDTIVKMVCQQRWSIETAIATMDVEIEKQMRADLLNGGPVAIVTNRNLTNE